MKIIEKQINNQLLKNSPFNAIGGDSKFIACVGENGGYDETTICDGFIKAVAILLNSIAEDETEADPMVYPILFSLRHSVELFLKKAYGELKYLECIKKSPCNFRKLLKFYRLNDRIKFSLENYNDKTADIFLKQRKIILKKILDKLSNRITELEKNIFKDLNEDLYTHDFNELISKITKIYTIDNHIKALFDNVLSLLNYYKDIDPKGDAFRYWNDKENNSHFEKNQICTVRLDIVHFQFEKIIDIFKQLDWKIWVISKEYRTGTFTKELSRSQIEEISKLLPSPENFSMKIKDIKEQIKSSYHISSNKFNDVLKIIKNHIEFSANMGIEQPFLKISDNSLKIFAKCSLGLDSWEIVYKDITKNELILFYTFSDISGWRYSEKNYAYFSEYLKTLFAKTKRADRLTNFSIVPKVECTHVIEGMQKCGQITYAKKLKQYIEEYTHENENICNNTNH